MWQASPHPRGWTQRMRLPNHGPTGFPAPAGMDPPLSRACCRRSWLPRTRGDGPARAERVGRPAPASPHPRGWTVCAGDRTGPGRGFPAPAGMDPAASGSAAPTGRLPRTRGDGPRSWSAAAVLWPASPHPRGWTQTDAAQLSQATGFPAPAGMDRKQAGGRRTAARLPRTRGDGPRTSSFLTASVEASPHPRGWTRLTGGLRGVLGGFPAPAGMDPPAARGPTGRARLPRTRGDGPQRPAHSHDALEASPHPRGWTVAAVIERLIQLGFPAPAGMDPGRRGEHRYHGRLPRTRGDGPC